MRITRVLMIVLAICLSASVAFAGGSTVFTYQGALAEAGEPANGLFDFEFSLWDADMGGSQIGSTQIHNAVSVADGLFLILLDFGADAFTNADRWLEVTVDTVLLSPRQPVTRVPYAIQTRGIFVDENQNIGIGTTTPDYPLHVETSSEYAIYATTDGETTRAVYGLATGPTGLNYGVFGESTGFGGGVKGLGLNIGVHGEAHGLFTSSIGVFGRSDSPTGRGLQGQANASTGVAYGVLGNSESTSGRGVYGQASASSGTTYGVYGRSFSTNGRGLYGEAIASIGTTYGVYGVTNSPDGYAGYFVGGRNYFEGNVGIGTDTPNAMLKVVSHTANPDNNTAEFLAAGIGPNPSHVHWGATGDWYIRSADPAGTVILQDMGGNVGIGTTTPAFLLEVNGDAGKPGGGSWSNSSDRCLKKNIEDLDGALDQLLRLRGVTFEYKDPDTINELHGTRIGMIAQEVEAVFPDWVTEGGHGYKTLTFRGFEALTVEALRELREEEGKEIATLRAERNSQIALRDRRIESLESANADLESRLNQLETLVSQLATQQGTEQ